jgi:DNA invertase Pin-like site-specific DNA recombinase
MYESTAHPAEFAGQSFGIYPRVSTAPQDDEDKASIDAQIEACKEYGIELGMVLDPACVRREAHTATTLDRPELRALLADLRARHIRNLVIDRVDRLTREGVLAAVQLLTIFIDAQILLHIASTEAVVRTETEVKAYIDAAYAAQQANVARSHALQRAKRMYAKKGRYIKGNRPPYGFVYETLAVDDRGRPTKYRLVADLRPTNGHKLWEVRQRICRWYLEGLSTYLIAELLTNQGAPTSRQLAKQRHASAVWSPTTVQDLLLAPVNYGAATSFRQKTELAPPDALHPHRWKRVVELPAERQIVIENAVLDPIITKEEADAIRSRLKRARELSPRTSEQVNVALLRGGMARCVQQSDYTNECGGALRVKRYGKNTPLRYVCRTHETQPARCPGLVVTVDDLDHEVWSEVFTHLLDEDKLRALAEQQVQLDTTDNPASERAHLQATRAGLQRKVDNTLDTISNTDNGFARAELTGQLEKLGEAIAQADEELVAHERLAADYEHRRNILSNITAQMLRYLDRIESLDIGNPHDVPFIRNICHSLGVVVLVWDDPGDGDLLVDVSFNLGAATATPWFGADDTDEWLASHNPATMPESC